MTYKSGLDPENDPVVFTTDYGLEIRYASAVTNSYLTGYTYFTMGKYDNKSLNWVIIGYDPSMYECVQDVSGEAFRDNPIQGGNFMTQLETIDNSAAGTAIIRDNFAISSKAQADFEVGTGCVLCLSECVFGSSTFGSTHYDGSVLQSNMQALYDTLDLPSVLKERIEPQTIYTVTSTTTRQKCENQLFFPPGYYSYRYDASFTEEVESSFCYQKYIGRLYGAYNLNGSVAAYWLRDRTYWNSSPVYIPANFTTDVGSAGSNNSTYGLRPMFVLGLQS